jgi:hypothetical protein
MSGFDAFLLGVIVGIVVALVLTGGGGPRHYHSQY